MAKTMCRICLAENIRMHPIVNTELQQVFEHITNCLLLTEGRPLQACYICYTRLKQCHQLMAKCFQAEEILVQMMKGKQLDQTLIDKLSSVNTLAMTPVLHVAAGDICTGTTDVKQEPVSEDDDDEQMKIEIVEHEVSYSTPNADLLIEQTQTQAETHHILSECGPTQSDLGMSRSEPKLLTMKKTAICKDGEIKSGTTTMDLENNERQSATCDDEMSPSEVFSYKCDVCQNCFKNQSGLTKHVRVHTDAFKCDVCQKCFSTENYLKSHLRVHTNIGRYTCKVCQKCFRDKSHLNRHIVVHTGVKPYKCDLCEKSFRDKSTLYIHICVNSSSKPYKCDICKKCFTKEDTLREHIRVHTAKKPYECKVCFKSYSLKGRFVAHLRGHTSEISYECDVCHKCFKYRSDLKKHYPVHTEMRYECNLCHKRMKHRDSLVKHIRLHTIQIN